MVIKNFLNNIYKFYSSEQRKEIKFFLILSLIGMFLEMLGIGLVVPLLTLLVEPQFLKNIIEFLNNHGVKISSEKELIFYSILAILSVFTIKTIFLSFVSYKQIRFLTNLKTDVSDKLYRIYLTKPFIFHLYNNSSKLIRDLNDSTQILIVTKSILILFTEVTVVIGILSLLIIYEPIGTLITSIFIFISGYLFYSGVQSRASKWGEERKYHEGMKLQWLQQGFTSIKDVKILNKENYFINSFTKQNKISNDTQFKQDFTLSLPRLWLELFAIVGFTILILLLINYKKDIAGIIPVLGFFAAAAFRMMPSTTRIMNSIQAVKFGFPVARTYINEFKNYDLKIKLNSEKNVSKIKFKNLIELNNINFSYPNSEKKVLRDINIKIPFGSSIGVYGNSGVGKSTFLNVFLQLLKPQGGKIQLDGKDISNFVRQWQNIMGYVPQNVYLNDDTLKKNIALGVPLEFIDQKKINQCLKDVKLNSFVDELKNGLDTKVGEFGERISGGQRQRIGIARALYNDPQILVLDEYTNALDETTESEIIKEVNSLKSNKTIITITHKNSALKFCDAIYKLTNDKGLIRDGL